jgi:putative transposase
MPRKKTSPERIISLLRQIEVQMASGVTLPQACKQAQISMQSYYRWRQEFGGLQVDQAKRLKEIERENNQLKKLVAELSLEKAMLKELAAPNW